MRRTGRFDGLFLRWVISGERSAKGVLELGCDGRYAIGGLDEVRSSRIERSKVWQNGVVFEMETWFAAPGDDIRIGSRIQITFIHVYLEIDTREQRTCSLPSITMQSHPLIPPGNLHALITACFLPLHLLALPLHRDAR